MSNNERARRRREERENDRAREYIDKHLRPTIRNEGWAIQGVGADLMAGKPSYGYTVGLTPAGLPELITYAITFGTVAVVLNGIARDLLRERIVEPFDGQVLEDRLEGGYKVCLVEATDERVWSDTAYAWRVYPNPPARRVLQVVTPDRSGRFPWEDGFDLDLAVDITIPLLGTPPAAPSKEKPDEG